MHSPETSCILNPGGPQNPQTAWKAPGKERIRVRGIPGGVETGAHQTPPAAQTAPQRGLGADRSRVGTGHLSPAPSPSKRDHPQQPPRVIRLTPPRPQPPPPSSRPKTRRTLPRKEPRRRRFSTRAITTRPPRPPSRTASRFLPLHRLSRPDDRTHRPTAAQPPTISRRAERPTYTTAHETGLLSPKQRSTNEPPRPTRCRMTTDRTPGSVHRSRPATLQSPPSTRRKPPSPTIATNHCEPPIILQPPPATRRRSTRPQQTLRAAVNETTTNGPARSMAVANRPPPVVPGNRFSGRQPSTTTARPPSSQPRDHCRLTAQRRPSPANAASIIRQPPTTTVRCPTEPHSHRRAFDADALQRTQAARIVRQPPTTTVRCPTEPRSHRRESAPMLSSERCTHRPSAIDNRCRPPSSRRQPLGTGHRFVPSRQHQQLTAADRHRR